MSAISIFYMIFLWLSPCKPCLTTFWSNFLIFFFPKIGRLLSKSCYFTIVCDDFLHFLYEVPKWTSFVPLYQFHNFSTVSPSDYLRQSSRKWRARPPCQSHSRGAHKNRGFIELIFPSVLRVLQFPVRGEAGSSSSLAGDKNKHANEHLITMNSELWVSELRSDVDGLLRWSWFAAGTAAPPSWIIYTPRIARWRTGWQFRA